ncbi:MAG: hypothetical protein ABJA81_05760 [Nocardioidaceae bacterium]
MIDSWNAALAEARIELGNEVVDAAIGQGEALTLREAIELASDRHS